MTYFNHQGTQTGRFSARDTLDTLNKGNTPKGDSTVKGKVHIIGLTGAQGTGKSTLLTAIAALKLPNIVIDDFSVPRSVQDDYGLPLADIVAVPIHIPEYQDRILARKTERIKATIEKYSSLAEAGAGIDTWVFADRTPIDFAAYAKTWVGKNKVGKDWLVTYQRNCAAAMKDYTNVLFLPVSSHFEFVSETQRGSKETQLAVHQNCIDFVLDYCGDNVRLSNVSANSVEDRVQQSLSYVAYPYQSRISATGGSL